MGFDPEAFWDQTPRLLNICFEAKFDQLEREQNLAGWIAWHTAALMRVKRMPPLDKMQAKRKLRSQSIRQQRNVAKAVTAFYGGKVKGG